MLYPIEKKEILKIKLKRDSKTYEQKKHTNISIKELEKATSNSFNDRMCMCVGNILCMGISVYAHKWDKLYPRCLVKTHGIPLCKAR